MRSNNSSPRSASFAKSTTKPNNTMITPERAQQDYEAAAAALQESAMTAGISTAERMTIRDALRELTLRYLGALEAEIQALTSQYQTFLTSMNAVVDQLKGGKTPVALLNRLDGIVDSGTALIGSLTAAVAGSGAKGLTRRSRSRARAPVAANTVRILCVHGVGHEENDPAFQHTWRNAITAGLATWNRARTFEIEFVAYDDLFAANPPDAFEVAAAIVKLGASGLIHGIGDLFHRPRGFGDVAESVRW